MRSIDHIASVFLRQILRRMKQLGLNQSALAQRMNVSRPYISKVLRSDVNISFATAAKLAKALEMDFFPELRATSPSVCDRQERGEKHERSARAGKDCDFACSAGGGR